MLLFCFQQLQASYSFYTWPCAPYLAWYLYEHRQILAEKTVLELGAGTALPSILAAKCGANVIITDSAALPKTLQNIRQCVEANSIPLERVKIIGITWGLFLSQIFELGPVDLIIASDCFYEPLLFEDIVATVAFLLERYPNARFVCSYQERSADWSVEHLLRKWSLACRPIDIQSLGATTKLDTNHLVQEHTIHLLEIARV